MLSNPVSYKISGYSVNKTLIAIHKQFAVKYYVNKVTNNCSTYFFNSGLKSLGLVEEKAQSSKNSTHPHLLVTQQLLKYLIIRRSLPEAMPYCGLRGHLLMSSM